MSAPAAGTIVLVTGANQGLGLEISRRLAADHPGYHVLMGARDSAKGAAAAAKLREEGLSVEPLTIDVSDDASIQKASEEVAAKHGRLDVLVNNAGIISEGKMPEGASLRETYHASFDVNACGVAIVTEAFIPLLKKSAHPRIVMMSTGLASCGLRNDPNDQYAAFQFPAYRASKTALNMISLHYALMFAKDGWKINACDPGFCATNLNGFRGWNTVESGAANAVRLATVGKDGPNATFTSSEGPLPW